MIKQSLQIEIEERDMSSLVPLQTHDADGNVTGDREEEEIKNDREAFKAIKFFRIKTKVGDKQLTVESPRGRDAQREDLLGEALNKLGKMLLGLLSNDPE